MSATGHAFSINDPILRYEVNDPGRYFIEVRELLGGGNEQSHYVLCIGNFPRPLALYPPGYATHGFEAIRVGGVFSVRHMPWYADPRHPPKDLQYYESHGR